VDDDQRAFFEDIASTTDSVVEDGYAELFMEHLMDTGRLE